MKLKDNFTLYKYGLQVRLVNEGDAELIVSLRTSPLLSKYLNPINKDINVQRKWIQKYKQRENMGIEYYFVFSIDGVILGFERIYNIEKDNFTHGSIIFLPKAPIGSSILADIITREIAFENLNKSLNFFDVRKGNTSVINYHKKFNPELIVEDQDSLYFKLDRINFEKNKLFYLRIFNLLNSNKH